MVTISDVARLAGVSKATASRALSRPELVSAGTLAKVADASEALGFVANNAARLLAGGRTGTIVVVVPSLTNAYLNAVVAGAQARVRAEGMQLTVAAQPLVDIDEVREFERLSRQVDGFIVAGPRGSDDLIRIATSRKPTVLVDREIEGMSSVTADIGGAVGAVAAHLFANGHRHLVYIGGPDGSWQDRQRVAAVEAAAEAAGARLDVLSPYEPTFDAGIRAASAVRGLAPSAVLPYATAIGLGVQHALLTAGDPVPVVTSERSIAEALGASVPTIDVDGQELGTLAAERLFAHIRDADAPADVIRTEVHVALPGA